MTEMTECDDKELLHYARAVIARNGYGTHEKIVRWLAQFVIHRMEPKVLLSEINSLRNTAEVENRRSPGLGKGFSDEADRLAKFEVKAAESAARFVDRYATENCRHTEAVADCPYCNLTFLARWTHRAIALLQSAPPSVVTPHTTWEILPPIHDHCHTVDSEGNFTCGCALVPRAQQIWDESLQALVDKYVYKQPKQPCAQYRMSLENIGGPCVVCGRAAGEHPHTPLKGK